VIGLVEDLIHCNWKSWFPDIKKVKKISFVKLASSSVVNRPLSFLLFDIENGYPFACLKIIRNVDRRHFLETEFKNLKYIYKTVSSEYVLSAIPRPIWIGEIENHIILLETALQGKTLWNIGVKKRKNFNKTIDAIIDWMVPFHRETTVYVGKISHYYIEKYLKSELDSFYANFNKINLDYKDILLETLAQISQMYSGIGFPILCQHGDISPHNILMRKKAIRIFDWEDSIQKSFPFLDICDLLTNFLCILNPQRISNDLFTFYILNENTNDIFRFYFSKYCSKLNINSKLLSLFFPFYLVRKANRDFYKYPNKSHLAFNWINRLNIFFQYHNFEHR